MKISEKCKIEFERWVRKQYPKYAMGYHNEKLSIFTDLTEQMTNALIIEFFDSVGVYISTDIDYNFRYFNYKVETRKNVETIDYVYNSRTKAVNKAIEKANETYNKN